MVKVTYYRSGQLEIVHLKNKRTTYAEHNHVSVYIIGFVLGGVVTLKLNGKLTSYLPGSFFIIPPYVTHELLLPDICDIVSICANKDLINSRASRELHADLSRLLANPLPDVSDVLLESAIDALYLCQTYQPPDSAILPEALSLRKNPQNTRCLRAMADEACYSPYHYIKRFKRLIGITPHKFQLQNKIRKAQRMIEDGKPPTEIALDLGFYDHSHFIKCFRNIVGLTPTEYRASVKRL